MAIRFVSEIPVPPSRQAAVLVPVYRDPAGSLRIVLIRRTDRGMHAGQVAFPGGRSEAGDRSLLATALRETHEEIGLGPERITILETLEPVHTRSSGYEIQPFLGRIDPLESWCPCPAEVAAILAPTVASLTGPHVERPARVRPPGWSEALDVTALHPDPETVVWGATYRILRPLLEPLRDGRWPV